ncbi:MAG: MFS transporter [Rhodoferax sp.]|nr:MFS transporter [Rhodoferax sp.]HQX58006.1 MFS transporter [Burkholderiaceae bacterium]HQZ06757.1 MFS transporter [Burkholderiaceae bacterium]
MTVLAKRTAITVFVTFAFAYFLSALIRAITATLSPQLTLEFDLHARDLGLLAGGYFLGFSATQLPLGSWLDRYGPGRMLACFLGVAALGCVAFAYANSFSGLLMARFLCGAGLSACLMAPLTGYRRWFAPAIQTRTNAWMLMTGSCGMVASTLPVQWLLPALGWRPMFLGLAVLLVTALLLIIWRVPGWNRTGAVPLSTPEPAHRYARVWRDPYFRRMAPLGFFGYGGLLAVQTLWAAPWMEKMAGYSPLASATGLFWINITMLCTFWTWGMVSPRLAHHGLGADRLISRGLPASFLVLALIIAAPDMLVPHTGAMLALYCMACSFVTPSQPAVAMAFPSELAGRALTAFNLVIFLGVFAIQWGIGLLIDGLMAVGASQQAAYRLAFTAYLSCCVASYVYFMLGARHNQRA